jgi:hypothetical protein
MQNKPYKCIHCNKYLSADEILVSGSMTRCKICNGQARKVCPVKYFIVSAKDKWLICKTDSKAKEGMDKVYYQKDYELVDDAKSEFDAREKVRKSGNRVSTVVW